MKKLLLYLACVTTLFLTGCATNQTMNINGSYKISISQKAMTGGNPNGSITLAFVYDYQCPYCHEMYPIVLQLAQEFPNLKIEMLPVAALNMTSLYEASAAIAASNTNQFWDFTNQVMSQDKLTDDQVTAVINQMGLNNQQFQYTMHSTVVERQLILGQKQMDAAQYGPPLFFIFPSALDIKHSEVLIGAQSPQAMVAAIQNVQEKMQGAMMQYQRSN